MKRIILLLASFLFIFTLSPQKALAQYSCGLEGQYCCDYPGSDRLCEEGLVCSGGICISDADDPFLIESETTTDSNSDSDAVLCPDGKSINTAIGCIPSLYDTNALITFILRWAIGIGGGIAFLLIIFAAFQIMTSSGNPDRLKAGRELMTSAIAGLILLIFSVFILRIIGVNILGVLPEG